VDAKIKFKKQNSVKIRVRNCGC